MTSPVTGEITNKIVQTPQEVDRFFTHKRPKYEPVDGETIFIIARHGENESNVADTYDGRTLNLPLTGKGFLQGLAVGQKLKNKVTHIDHVILTRMCRTYQTSLGILNAFPYSRAGFTEDNRFFERNVGRFEGGTLDALKPTNKQDKEISSSPTKSFQEKMNFSPDVKNIETYASIWKRVQESLQERSGEHKGKVVLAVTHSGTIRSIYWHLTQKLGFFVPYKNFKPDNGAFMIVSVKNGEMELLETDNFEIIPSQTTKAATKISEKTEEKPSKATLLKDRIYGSIKAFCNCNERLVSLAKLVAKATLAVLVVGAALYFVGLPALGFLAAKGIGAKAVVIGTAAVAGAGFMAYKLQQDCSRRRLLTDS